MFNGKEKVRRTYVEWKEEFYLNLTTAYYGCPRRNFEKTAVYSQATKKTTAFRGK